jgi:hypothetical protein
VQAKIGDVVARIIGKLRTTLSLRSALPEQGLDPWVGRERGWSVTLRGAAKDEPPASWAEDEVRA